MQKTEMGLLQLSTINNAACNEFYVTMVLHHSWKDTHTEF